MRPDASNVKQKNAQSLRASKQAASALPPPKNAARVPRSPVPPPQLPPGLQPPAATPTLDLPPGVMLGAVLIGEMLDRCQAMPFCEAVAVIDGLWQLTEHHPDLRIFANAFTLICMGERKLLELRGNVNDDVLEAALEVRLDRALPLIEQRLRHFARIDPSASQYLDMLAHIKRGLAVLDGLRAQLAAL